MSNTKKNKLFNNITMDSKGMIDFYDFSDEILSKFISYVDEEKIDIEKIKRNSDLSEVKKCYKLYKLWQFICSQTSERIVLELSEDYCEDKVIISNIKSMLIEILTKNYMEKMKINFSKYLKDYIEYKDEVHRRYTDLRNLYDECHNGNKGLVFKSKKELAEEKKEEDEDLIDFLFEEEYRDEMRAFFKPLGDFIKGLSEAIAIDSLADRINSLTYKMYKFDTNMDSYINYTNPEMLKYVRDYVSKYVDDNYYDIVEKDINNEYTKRDYLELIKSLCKLRKLMPGTISVVISEIVRIANENGIELHDMYMSLFEIPEDLADHAEYTENCEPVHVYRI